MKKISKREVNRFVKRWKDGGNEDQESHKYWYDLLKTFCSITDIDYLDFEKHVKVKDKQTGKITDKKIDIYMPSNHILIENKSSTVSMTAPQGRERLTPTEQAFRYYDALPYDDKGKYVIICNFIELWLYDMNNRTNEPKRLNILDFENNITTLQNLFSASEAKESTYKQETEISTDTADYIAGLYDSLIKLYDDKDSDETKHDLNVLIVRLVFLMFAEDTPSLLDNGIFTHLVDKTEPEYLNIVLSTLFKVLDTPKAKRKNIPPDIKPFEYINGGLFAEEIELPVFDDEAKKEILHCCGFNWSKISPTIFGAVFESTVSAKQRHDGGMHYTSLSDIHKVIDPLFLDDLKEELNRIVTSSYKGKALERKYSEYINKLSALTFLDPACGSGNFLTETYISLRRLENKALTFMMINDKKAGSNSVQSTAGFSESEENQRVKVSISQMHGIEIDDFACTVARTALWIAEAQMYNETAEIIYDVIPFFPLKSKADIVKSNALRLDWHNVVNKADYLIGNPPFVGSNVQSPSQKADMKKTFDQYKTKYKKLDYVTAWYVKAAEYMKETKLKAALVSTNSITQGEQIPILWSVLYKLNIHINFAYRSFRWDNEANERAHVHCVIIGFSNCEDKKNKLLYDGNDVKIAKHINGYLLDGPEIIVESAKKPICQNVLKMVYGNKAYDKDKLKLNSDEYKEITSKYPKAKKWIKKLMGSREFIHNESRYCLWLVNCTPAEIKSMPPIYEKVKQCKEARLKAGSKEMLELSKTPAVFRDKNNPKQYLLIPSTSSENREYVPIGFLDRDTIPSNGTLVIPNAGLYELGVLESSVHMAWMRAVCGRLETRYRYSKNVVYNTFPWPSVTDSQRVKIENNAKMILKAREIYPDSDLSELYDKTAMPPELTKAHEENNKEVLKAYGLSAKADEKEIVKKLFDMYQKLSSE